MFLLFIAEMSSVENDIVTRVRSFALPVLEAYGLELVDIFYGREPGGWVVRISMDKEGGVTLADCSKVSQELGYILEVKDVISHPFNLEVSSPGLDRPLRTEQDFERFTGKRAKIKTSRAIDERHNFKGILRGIQDGHVLLEIDHKSWKIPLDAISKANLIYEFSE
ncbi:MAG TPA: ribosome maturation factor RimP [Thermodesulfobacteriota bacterium]|nr:ribosome maturation factor RimP [Thermodesulfobacteriota bacterium]